MAQNLSEIYTTLRQILEGNESLDLNTTCCDSDNSILPRPFEIRPQWEIEEDRIFRGRKLQEDRIRRGTGVPVDLGLSVLWSSRNMGAPSGEQPGYYVGWGDETGRKTTSDDSNYPNSSPPSDISGSSHDIARRLWAETWRIPTMKEMEELLQQCRWFWTSINGVPGYQVVGSNGNSIFLPAAGSRFGTDYDDAYSFGRYWTSSLNQGNNARAFLLEFSVQGTEVISMGRHIGMNIRPVLDK